MIIKDQPSPMTSIVLPTEQLRSNGTDLRALGRGLSRVLVVTAFNGREDFVVAMRTGDFFKAQSEL
jgi:hypothetical protein